jgi:hypothetical protein
MKTVQAAVGSAHLWIDYGRPALRGRDVWANGVLGDTLWRTGANAATQFRTDVDLVLLLEELGKAENVHTESIGDPQLQNGRNAVSTFNARIRGTENGLVALEPAPPSGFSGAAVIDAQGQFVGLAGLKAASQASPDLRPSRSGRDGSQASQIREWRSE